MPLFSILVFLALRRIGDEVSDALGKIAAVVAAMSDDMFLQLSPESHCQSFF
jgi:hypothetical protein